MTEGQNLILSYETNELQRTCLEPEYAIRKLGVELTRSLQVRLADLDAADHLVDVPLGIDLSVSTLSCIPVHLLDRHYVMARANHVTVWGPSSKPAWDRISRLQLTHFQEIPK